MHNLLKEKYPYMSRAGKKIADFIIEYPDEFLNMTSGMIAQKSGTSPATVVRFARTLGFKSLEDLKISTAKNLTYLSEAGPLNVISCKGDDTQTLINKLSGSLNTSIYSTLKNINTADFEQAVEFILSSKCVYLYGIGASALVARDLHHKLNRANIKAVYNSDTHMGVEVSYYISLCDVVIVFSYSGMTKEVNIAAEQAKKNGAKVIAVTKEKQSRLTQNADIVFLVPNLEGVVRIGAISSKYSSMVIADLLFLSIVNAKYDDIEQGFIETSKMAAKLKERLK